MSKLPEKPKFALDDITKVIDQTGLGVLGAKSYLMKGYREERIEALIRMTETSNTVDELKVIIVNILREGL